MHSPEMIGFEHDKAKEHISFEDLKNQIALLEEQIKDAPKGSRLRLLRRQLSGRQAILRRLELNFPGRHIPDEIAHAVAERDRGGNFGRPKHVCERPGPPHHIKHYATLKAATEKENPHTMENLEAPCNDCHSLAHAMDIPSGISIENYFKAFNEEQWRTVEQLWQKQRISDLKKYVKANR